MPQHLRRTLLTALCATAVVGLAACSSSSTSTAVTTATTPTAKADAGLQTGAKLEAMLLPASAVPSSLKLNAPDSRQTGTTFSEPSAAPVSKTQACNDLSENIWVGAAGIGSGSFAQNDYTDSYGDMFAQEVDAFRGNNATTVMANLEHVFTECKAYPFSQSGTTYTEHLSWKALPGVGDQAMQAVITSPSFNGGTTLVAVRVGNLVATTLYNDQNTTGSAGVALTERLAKNLG